MISTLLYLVILALDIWAIFSVLMGGSSIERKVLWILVILLLPVLGLVLYLIMGRNSSDARLP